ncbi:4-hydroxythreonine-4-phosphate dehydrogenase PdxA [Emcibacter sp. SYSU 3D8]|uniref:4-hydroxythreonine-4-phosphate dehydrogenase PdxA n=1 Tax=Emcibacter sp. SYSU 3D8 TaxID=3133969 RepID=UPI0031FEFFB9
MTRSSTTNRRAPPLALTMGEPAGIGPDISLAAWMRRGRARVPPFFLLACPDLIRQRIRQLKLDVPVREISRPDDAADIFPNALPVLALARSVRANPGSPDPGNGAAVLESIETATALFRQGKASAIVTNPIQKSVLYAAGFEHPGHTEFLEFLAGPDAFAVMMLAIPGLRVVPVTVHQALSAVPAALTADLIVRTGRTVAASLRNDFGIQVPRLAVAGLNPHAGEAGTMGREEVEIIAPAIAALRDDGIDVAGPKPADTMFHKEARAAYDAALCMYHDQALIPLKTVNFHEGVNVTIGLPFVRTSPDHGTALDIAGSGKADPRSLIAALKLAGNISRARGRAKKRAAS